MLSPEGAAYAGFSSYQETLVVSRAKKVDVRQNIILYVEVCAVVYCLCAR